MAEHDARSDHQPSDRGAKAWRRVLAWSIHLFTACGIIFCLLAIEAGLEAAWRRAFVCLAVAVAIDGIDGTLARWVRVKEILPHFDGALLDNVIDYVGYVVVPAFLLHHAGLLPPAFSLPVVSAVCVASAFQFCQADAKTPDHCFKGFPSYWNIVVLYLLVLDLGRPINLAVTCLLIVLIFVPIKYIYPSRTPYFRKSTLVLTLLWTAAILVIIAQLPNPRPWLVYASLLYVVYYTCASVYISLHGRLQLSSEPH